MIATNLCAVYGIEGWLKPIADRLCAGDYTAVFITFDDRYRFDAAQADRLSGNKIVVFDFCEYGPAESWRNTHVFGHQPVNPRPIVSNEEYLKLGEWLLRQNVILYFKREFSSMMPEFPLPIIPIDLLAPYNYEQPPCTKEQWMSRPGGLFFLYGHSNDDRVLLAAELSKVLGVLGGTIKMNDHQPLVWNLIELIHASNRYPMSRVVEAQGKSVLSVALPGYGVKCFRNCEAGQNCVPVVADLGMKWAVPWTEENAVLLPTQDGKLKLAESVEIIVTALSNREALYEKLGPAMDSSNRLAYGRFGRDYINPNIQKYL